MAREHARILLSVWEDDDFLALRSTDQWAYFALLSHRDLSWCGVSPLLPQRYANLASDMTAGKANAALRNLEQARFVVADHDTAEIAARTFVRHDGIMKKPNVLIAALKAFEKVHSPQIRESLRCEFARAYTEGFPEGFGEPFGRAFGRSFPEGLPEPFGELFGEQVPELFANSPSPFPLPPISATQPSPNRHLADARDRDALGLGVSQ